MARAQRLTGGALLIGALTCAIDCSEGRPVATPRCVASEVVGQIAVSNVDHLDVLFVIDDSSSMAQQQNALRARLPALMRMLVTGEVGGGMRTLAAQDLHVAIVSATLSDGGDTQRVPAVGAAACAAQYPAFLSYRGSYYGPTRNDPDAFVDDFACASQLGSEATGANQSLEAALAALSDPQRNPGFLRNDPEKGLSMIAVVVVTDTDDCSAPRAAADGAPTTSAACAAQADTLQTVDHYVTALRALRKGNENLVVFGAIAGVPPRLVDEAARARVNFDNREANDAFYDNILQQPEMQSVPDSAKPDHLQPACIAQASAEPARRLVQMVQRFGSSGALASICAGDWKGAITPWFATVAKQLGLVCLPHPVPRAEDGLVSCQVFMDLPPAGAAPDGTPNRCNEREYLTLAEGEASHPGGQRCAVRQLAIRSDADVAAADPNHGGWYYDDFSDNVRRGCTGAGKATIAFTEFTKPATGVVVTMQCSTLHVLSASDGATADGTACRVPDAFLPSTRADDVGRSCKPAEIPENGFADNEVYVDTGGSRCTTGACMVYRLRGDPRLECNDSLDFAGRAYCARPDDVANRIYCTCRCDAADTAGSPCACPRGFSCEPVLNRGTSNLAGSYCVKDGTFTAP